MLGILALAGCVRAGAPSSRTEAPDAAAPLSGVHLRATLEPGAGAVDVHMCFDGVPPPAVSVATPDAAPHIQQLRVVDRDVKLAMRRGRVELAALAAGECLGYRVDFKRMAAHENSRAVSWVGDSVVVRQSMWLLWPSDLGGDVDVTLELELPQGMRASVPWLQREGPRPTYVLDDTVTRWLGYTAFGELTIEALDAHGAHIEIARLDAEMSASPRGVEQWILDAVESVAMLYEGYPRKRLQVVVVPIDGGGGTVYFGMAARGGGSGVLLLVDRDAQDRELPGGWTTVHELLHHGMPFVREAWMGEGFVSYYTEIMRTRMGHRSEADGWRELADAFARGRGGGRGLTLSASSARMMDLFAFQRVYWGGGAIAFEIDVAVRLDSNGKLGLDDAMRELRRCCGDAPKRWPAATLLKKLDAWYGKPIFTKVANEHLDRIAFPDTDATLAKLGVKVDGDRVTMDDEHPAAAIRRAIMAPRK